MEAFSDGVFAIAITLLILEIKVPQVGEHGSPAALWQALLRLWPSYLAYLLRAPSERLNQVDQPGGSGSRR